MLLDDKTLHMLQDQIESVSNQKVKTRIRAILFHHEGLSKQEIASELGISSESVRRWLQAFENKGINGLVDKARSGRPKKLKSSYESKLKELLKKQPQVSGYRVSKWTISSIQKIAQSKFGITVSKSFAHRLLSEAWKPEKQAALTINEHRKKKREFENRLAEFGLTQRFGSGFWYIHRIYAGKFLEGTGNIKTNYDYDIFCAINISSIESLQESLIEISITSSSKLHPLSESKYTEFIKRLVEKYFSVLPDVSNLNKKARKNLKPPSPVNILLQPTSWGNSAANMLGKEFADNTNYLLTPIESLDYNIPHMIVIKKLQSYIRKTLNSFKLNPTKINDQLTKVVKTAFKDALNHYHHKTFGKIEIE